MNFITELIASNPLASLGLLSLLIPILIHLFNPNRGKTVLIGNLYLIEKVKNTKVTEVKIRQWLLLVTRIIFLTTLTLLLIDLLFPKIYSTKKGQSVFVTNAWLMHATKQEKDKLLAKKNEQKIYLMQPGFTRVEDFSNLKSSTPYPYSLDSLIIEAHTKQLLTSKNQVYFSSNNDFLAEYRNSLFLNHHPDILFEWIKLENEPNDSKLTNQIEVYHSADRTSDFKLLKTALDLIVQANAQLTISYHLLPENNDSQLIQQLNNGTLEDSRYKLYFWLSSLELPQVLMRKIEHGSVLIRDSQPPLMNDKLTNISIADLGFNIYHPLPSLNAIESIPVWNTHQGILLSYKPAGKGRLLQFNSRFNDNWNNLADGTTLLDLVGKLLEFSPANNHHQVVNSSLKNHSERSRIKTKSTSINYQSYRNITILILAILWLLERFLAESKVYRHD